MIIVDFSAISIASVFAQPQSDLNEDFLRHMILNSIRMYNLKYRDEYGKMILACDSYSWRKNVFPYYKAARKKNRESSDMDWDSIFGMLNNIKDEIADNFPFPVLTINGAEADDIVATLVENTQVFGQHEKVMIISSDKDFVQLQKYNNVRQWSPMAKKLIKESDPQKYLFEHIVRGDTSDGVPNVLSEDNVFVGPGRQKPLRSTKISEWYEMLRQGQSEETIFDEQTYRNYIRNKTVIDLSMIPKEIAEKINDTYKSIGNKPNSKILNYLVSKRCNQLVACADEFFVKS